MTRKPENNTAPFSSSIFALEAFESVHKDKAETYERMGVAIDDLVRDSEPGMLVHALTKISENGDEVVYRWLEVFDGERALEAHLNNPHVIAHIATMADGILSGDTKLVIYSDWDDEKKAFWRDKLSGADLTFAQMFAGFFVDR